MASASEKSPRGAGDLHTGMNEIEITGFASRPPTPATRTAKPDFVEAILTVCLPRPRQHQDLLVDKKDLKISFPPRPGCFLGPLPRPTTLLGPLPTIKISPRQERHLGFVFRPWSFLLWLGSRSHVFVCVCCCSCSCKVVLEVKNANKIAAFGKEMLIRCEAHAEMIRSWQMDARPLKRARSCEGGHK